jgi:hypothetical protein
VRRWWIRRTLAPLVEQLRSTGQYFDLDRAIGRFSFDRAKPQIANEPVCLDGSANRGQILFAQLNLFVAMALPTVMRFQLDAGVVASILLFTVPIPAFIVLSGPWAVAWSIANVFIALYWIGGPTFIPDGLKWCCAIMVMVAFCQINCDIRRMRESRDRVIYIYLSDYIRWLTLIPTMVGIVLLYSGSYVCLSASISAAGMVIIISTSIIAKTF